MTGSAAVDVCVAGGAQRTIHYDVAAIDVNIPINGWGDFQPQGMMYALNNPAAVPNVEQIKDPNFKLYQTTDLTVPDKIQPLVLRANKGDCIEVTLTNRLDIINTTIQTPFTPADGPAVPINNKPGARNVGMQITGLALDVSISDGANVGFNPDTTVAQDQNKTYRWFANRTGGFLFRDTSNPQYPQDTISKGMYGMIIVEQPDSVWYDMVTGMNFLKVNGAPTNLNIGDLTMVGTDPITGKPMFLGVGASIFASVHQKEPCNNPFNCAYPLPRGTLLYENVSGNDYRSYAMIMQDEMEGIVGPIAWDAATGNVTTFGAPFFPATGLPDPTFVWNYKSEPLRNRLGAWLRHRGLIPTRGSPPVSGPKQTIILPNGRVFDPDSNFCGDEESASDNEPGGPLYKFNACDGEESHLQSWPFGDPAAPLPRAYWSDPVVMYGATASAHETHTYHQHAQRWFHDPDQGDVDLLPLPDNALQLSNRLDVQGIGPGETFKLVFEQGAGSTMGTAGDEVVHCHLYPHFAGGLWSAFRVFDKLRVVDPTAIDLTIPVNGNINATIVNSTTGALEPVLYPDGTQEAVLLPLPAKEALITTVAGERMAPPAPRGMPNRTAGVPNTTHPGYPNFIAGKYGLKALQPPMFVVNQSNGTAIGDRAIPTQLEIKASYDGLSPGVTLVDPCRGPNGEFGDADRKPDRIYQPVAIQVPYLLNPRGWFNPEQRAYVEKELVASVRKDPRTLRPYSFRANLGDCVEVYGKNDLQPNPETATLGVNDGIFHGPTVTNEISNHIHLLRFDELGTDGTSVNWNYDISQRVGETGAYRWFVDVNLRTIFSHDHQFPTSHQQGGVWSAFIVEPKNSTYLKQGSNTTLLGPVSLDPDINALTASGTNIKGVGVAAIINVTNLTGDGTGGISGGNISAFREFAVHYSDFTPAFFVQNAASLNAAFDALNASGILVTQPFKNDSSLAVFDPAFRTLPYAPPFHPDKYGDDQGMTTLNYRVEPFQTRVSDTRPFATQREPAYVYSSKVHGDPYTADFAAGEFRAYMNDPVVIRLMDGAHEEHHVFELHGHRWLHQPADPDSFLTDNQASNIGEWFNYEAQGNINRIIPGLFKRNGGALKAGLPGDYLMGETSMENKWNGGWGIFRVENGRSPNLAQLPGMPNPPVVPGLGLLGQVVDPASFVPRVNDLLTVANSPCPLSAPIKLFNITAIQKPLQYNTVYNESDPFGLMYVLHEERQLIRSGAKKPEPLVIRANQGDCVVVNLRNELPDLRALAQNTTVNFPQGAIDPGSASSVDPQTLQHFGDAQMNTLVRNLPRQPGVEPQHVFAKWPMSSRVSLHPHLVKESASVGDGATVGFMRDQTIGPGQSIRYIWYADEELGATLLDSYGDERSQRHHGLFAGLVIEPKGSTYRNASNPSQQIRSGQTAVIQLANGKRFREFVPLFMTGLNLRNDTNTLIPDFPGPIPPDDVAEVEHVPCSPQGVRCNDIEDTGESGINYRTERLVNRVPLALDAAGFITEEVFNPDQYKVFSSKDFGDPATPIFEANVGDPVVIRPMLPADLNRVTSIGLNGHVWRHEPDGTQTNIVNVEGAFGVGKSFNYWLIGGAGGEQNQPGDYMYNNRINAPHNAGVQSGLWGIFRVYPVPGAPAPSIVPLANPATVTDLPQIGP